MPYKKVKLRRLGSVSWEHCRKLLICIEEGLKQGFLKPTLGNQNQINPLRKNHLVTKDLLIPRSKNILAQGELLETVQGWVERPLFLNIPQAYYCG